MFENSRSYQVMPVPASLLGEGPVWDAHTASVYWVDILNGKLHEYDTIKQQYSSLQFDEMIGAIALIADGGLVAALKSGINLVDRNTAAATLICHPEENLTGNRYNDGKCDPAGRFWIGSMSLEDKPEAGSLYMIDKNGHYSKQLQDISISNGMAWSPDHSVFYHIDTPTGQVRSFDYDKSTGRIKNGKTAIVIPEEEGYPDGMTIDREGMLWIAHWDGWQVARWDPFTGKKLHQIRLPVARITSCTFGGNLLQDLYITSAAVGLTAEQRREQPLAGSLFVVPDCGFQGLPAHEFNYQIL